MSAASTSPSFVGEERYLALIRATNAVATGEDCVAVSDALVTKLRDVTPFDSLHMVAFDGEARSACWSLLEANGQRRKWNNVQAAAPGMPAPVVTVVTATVQDVPKYLDEIGRNAAFESVTVTPQVGGRITERHFTDGENLTKGQLLFVIDPRPYKAQVDAAQASLNQAKAALELAKIQFARDEEVIGRTD